MKLAFHLTLLEGLFLTANTIAFIGCLVLLGRLGVHGPLVFLTFGTGLGIVGQLGSSYVRAATPAEPPPLPKERSILPGEQPPSDAA